MKRLSCSFFAAASVPLSILFVLTVGASRLYAETGVPITCTTAEQEACATKAPADPCTFDGGAGSCALGMCQEPDGGLATQVLLCVPSEVAGDDGGESEASADAGALPDANADSSAPAAADAGRDAAGPVEGGKDTSPTSDGKGGCSIAGRAGAAASGAGAGSLLAVGAVLALSRRRRRARAA